MPIRRVVWLLVPLLTACEAEPVPDPYRELYELGLDRYLDAPEVLPTYVEEIPSAIDESVVSRYHFGASVDGARGPVCMRGAEYVVDVVEGTGDDLLLFLQGGGVCVEQVCMATDTVIAFSTIQLLSLYGGGGVLSRGEARNPYANADLVYLPYCDGSMFVGDVDRDLHGGVAYQRGLLNLSAALGVAAERFPNPRRVIVMGTSGGAYGTLPAVALARSLYPTTDILAVSDSGAPIAQDVDPTFVQRCMDEFHAPLVPTSCAGCVADGHLTGLIDWALERDENMRLAYMGHAQDKVIGGDFQGLTGPQMETAVRREIGELLAGHPARTSAFLLPGTSHTFIEDLAAAQSAASWLGDVTSGGMSESGVDTTGATVTAWQWLARFDAGPNAPSVLLPPP